MFPRRHSKREVPTAIETLRDMVEIIAILAAGVWAFYTFVYENRIKPANAPPNLVFKATMQRLGTHDGLTAIRLETSVRNIGATKIQFLGYAYYVQGRRVLAARGPVYPAKLKSYNVLLYRYQYSAPTTVWRLAYVTHAGDPAVSPDFFLEPGNGDDRDDILYVKTGSFDQLTASVVALYTKNTSVSVPTSMSISSSGIPAFNAKGGNAEQTSAPLTSIDLTAR